MSDWSLLLCEGAHDQEFLCTLATQSGAWEHPKKRPRQIPDSFKSPLSPDYLALTRNGRALLIANMRGIGNIIPDGKNTGASGLNLITKQAASVRAVGIMLDANGVGVDRRTAAVNAHYAPAIAAAQTAAHGLITNPPPDHSDKRRFGLWVAPDGITNGSLDDLIRKAADSIHPNLTPIADQFIEDLGKTADHPWEQYRQKAVLGALGQIWRAGGPLAGALQERAQWMTQPLSQSPPFLQILQFMTNLIE